VAAEPATATLCLVAAEPATATLSRVATLPTAAGRSISGSGCRSLGLTRT
jgi:hypothetical protein